MRKTNKGRPIIQRVQLRVLPWYGMWCIFRAGFEGEVPVWAPPRAYPKAYTLRYLRSHTRAVLDYECSLGAHVLPAQV